MQKKYGFIYIWRDRKHKRYYVGSHWGRENDGYVCSSSWMKRAYVLRSQDFKRRILFRVYTSRKELLDEEYKWLNMICDSELGTRYYNLRNKRNGHWVEDNNKYLAISNKISQVRRNKPKTSWNKGKSLSLETRAKISASKTGQKYETFSIKLKALWQDPAYREKQRVKKIGRKQSQEHIQRRSETIIKRYGKFNHSLKTEKTKNMIALKVKQLWQDPAYREKRLHWGTKKKIEKGIDHGSA